MIEQTVINAGIAGLLAALSFILKVIWDGLRELQKADIEQSAQISNLRILMADSYIRKEDFERMTNALFNKLDKIEGKLDGKADRQKQ